MPTPRWPISRDTPLTATTAMNHLQTSKHVPPSPAAGRVRGRLTMIRSNLRVDVYDPYILVSLRGTCFRAKYRRQDAPWLATDEYGPEDPEATITSNEFRALAWAAANEEARQLGWIRSFDELHKAIAASAIGVRANGRLYNSEI